MVSLFSLFLLLFHSFVQAEISSNCAKHACLRIHGCVISTGGNAIWYFKMVSRLQDDSTATECTKAYITIVFEQSARDEWSIEVATNVSDKTLRYAPNLMRDYFVYYGDNLTIGPNKITLNGSVLLDNFTSIDLNTGGLWTAKLKYSNSLHIIDWKEPRMVLSLASEDIRWCKKDDGTGIVELLRIGGKDYCNTDIRFSKKERDRFIEKLRKEEEKTWESNETAIVQRLLDSSSVYEGNCSLETIEDYCRKDCLKITMLNDSLECDSQLWLKSNADQWWKVDEGRCGANEEWMIIRNSRRHNYSTNAPVLQCSKHVPACNYDIDLPITILLIYSGIMTVVIIALYAVLYRILDKRVAPVANETPPSIYSCESTETKSQQTLMKSVKTKREEKAPMVEPMKTVFDDGNYENLTIHK